MSSLFKDHQIDPTITYDHNIASRSCWEILDCSYVRCPVHGRRDKECWLTSGTHCSSEIGYDFIGKLSHCMACDFFKLKGEHHPRGWNHFVAKQLQRFNQGLLSKIYQSEESFVQILNRLPDGLFTTDHEYRITYFNPAAEKITGFSAYDAVGMYCKDVFKNEICKKDCALKMAVVEGKEIHNREYRITNIEGVQVPIICSTSAFCDESGNVTGGLEIFKDISEVKRLQKEVVHRKKNYIRLFEGSHDMIYTSTPDGRLLDINQAGVELLGYRNKKELLNRLSAWDLYRNPSDRKQFLQRITANGEVKDYEVEFKTRDHSTLHVLISSRLYQNLHTGEVELEGIIKDITHRKSIEMQVNQRNRELSVINSIAVALNHNMDLDELLAATITKVSQVIQVQRAGVFLIDKEARKICLRARQNLPEPAGEDMDQFVFSDEMLKRYLIEGEKHLPMESFFPCFTIRYRSTGGQTNLWLTCFLIVFKGSAVGFFGFHIPPDRLLSHREIHLMGSLGNFMGGAIENIQMMEMIQKHRQELQGLTKKLFQTQENERRRIATELHDEAGQSLTGIKLGLDRLEAKHQDTIIAEDIEEIRKMIRRTGSEIRRLSYRLHPTLLTDLGLEPALKLYFEEIKKNSGMEINFQMVGFDQRLDAELETILYRFSQEILTNTLKHSGAEMFSLSIIKSYPRIIFLAEDNGVGFQADTIHKDRFNLGLLGMRERVSLNNGVFHLRSIPGEGTWIRIEIPYNLGGKSGHE
ncbi:MAG: PAS domain S-box protein [Desulfobacteraceae bacterium]|nr:PAS domain S-box protein [Desulfobacteraceae bacterium]